jgi:hypothetical protein
MFEGLFGNKKLLVLLILASIAVTVLTSEITRSDPPKLGNKGVRKLKKLREKA